MQLEVDTTAKHFLHWIQIPGHLFLFLSEGVINPNIFFWFSAKILAKYAVISVFNDDLISSRFSFWILDDLVLGPGSCNTRVFSQFLVLEDSNSPVKSSSTAFRFWLLVDITKNWEIEVWFEIWIKFQNLKIAVLLLIVSIKAKDWFSKFHTCIHTHIRTYIQSKILNNI